MIMSIPPLLLRVGAALVALATVAAPIPLQVSTSFTGHNNGVDDDAPAARWHVPATQNIFPVGMLGFSSFRAVVLVQSPTRLFAFTTGRHQGTIV